MSIDEDELLKLIGEDTVNESGVRVTSVDTADLERELSSVLSGETQAVEALLEEVEQSEMCPVTPEDFKELEMHQMVRKSGKDSSTDGSSVESESNEKRIKRKVEQGSKSPSKKTRYFETDNTERHPGWAEKLLKNRKSVVIPQNKMTPKKPIEVAGKNGYINGHVNGHRGVVMNGRVRGPMLRPMDDGVMPPGWLDCPGLEGKWGFFLFSKTPLGERWNHRIPQDRHYTPRIILQTATEREQPIGLVIDLNNSSLYYDPSEFERRGVQYRKIRCSGHGSTPSEEAVNEFWWIVTAFERRKTEKFILVHCTHGFNRTGFMVAHFSMRWAERDTMNSILMTFALRRPPGIYKDQYINELLDCYHESRSPKLITPPVPAWKGTDREENEDRSSYPDAIQSQTTPITSSRFWVLGKRVGMVSEVPVTSDDPIGERIHPQEEAFLRSEILNLMLGPHHPFKRFPGAQPVSMDRNNIELLTKKRYWVTYKADGTRYMLLLTSCGVFVINRDFEFQRVEQRFPSNFKMNGLSVNPGIPHHMTLLDGEMVIDHDKERDRYIRKYLVYDLVLYQGQAWMELPWKQRFAELQEIIKLRNSEIEKIQKKQWPFEYRYEDEPFRVEAKMFWFMGQAEGIVKIIPTLRHECDGFIFQAYEDKYQVGTHEELLKWKYPHLNSVDFRYRHNSGLSHISAVMNSLLAGGCSYLLRKREIPCEKVKIIFKEGNGEKYDGKIVECSYDRVNDRWMFLRERVDKKLPNAYNVYEKVLKSIGDNITQQELMHRMLNLFAESELYKKDREKLADYHPIRR